MNTIRMTKVFSYGDLHTLFVIFAMYVDVVDVVETMRYNTPDDYLLHKTPHCGGGNARLETLVRPRLNAAHYLTSSRGI